MFDPSGCSCRLRGCPFLTGRCALLRGGFIWDATMVSEAGAFLLDRELQHHCQETYTQFGTPYVTITADRYFPKAGKQLDRVTARGY